MISLCWADEKGAGVNDPDSALIWASAGINDFARLHIAIGLTLRRSRVL